MLPPWHAVSPCTISIMTLEIKTKEPTSKHRAEKNPAREGSACYHSYHTPSLQQGYQDMCELFWAPHRGLPVSKQTSFRPLGLRVWPSSSMFPKIPILPHLPALQTIKSPSWTWATWRQGKRTALCTSVWRDAGSIQTLTAYWRPSRAGGRHSWPCVQSGYGAHACSCDPLDWAPTCLELGSVLGAENVAMAERVRDQPSYGTENLVGGGEWTLNTKPRKWSCNYECKKKLSNKTKI